MASESGKHLQLFGGQLPHKESSALDGAQCIAKHKPFQYQEGVGCCYRWQAYEKALEEHELYALSTEQLQALGQGRWQTLFRGGSKQVARLLKKGANAALSTDNKGMYFQEVDKPNEGDWDISRSNNNFKYDCNVPYYHEAHHLVADGLLRACISEVFGAKGPGLPLYAAKCMMNAPYNVHHKDNMIILPMDGRVADVLQLPIHREAKKCNHSNYDDYVATKVKQRLKTFLKAIMQQHDEDPESATPSNKGMAESIQKLSEKTLYPEISHAKKDGHSSIDAWGMAKQGKG